VGLYSLYASSNIIWVIKSRRMRLAGNVACMEIWEMCTYFGWKTWRKETFRRPRCRWIISDWILGK